MPDHGDYAELPFAQSLSCLKILVRYLIGLLPSLFYLQELVGRRARVRVVSGGGRAYLFEPFFVGIFRNFRSIALVRFLGYYLLSEDIVAFSFFLLFVLWRIGCFSVVFCLDFVFFCLDFVFFCLDFVFFIGSESRGGEVVQRHLFLFIVCECVFSKPSRLPLLFQLFDRLLVIVPVIDRS